MLVVCDPLLASWHRTVIKDASWCASGGFRPSEDAHVHANQSKSASKLVAGGPEKDHIAVKVSRKLLHQAKLGQDRAGEVARRWRGMQIVGHLTSRQAAFLTLMIRRGQSGHLQRQT
jgi:hypothetical protein